MHQAAVAPAIGSALVFHMTSKVSLAFASPAIVCLQVAGAQALPIKFYKGKGNSTSKDEVQQLTAKAA